jgi:hypothetical protein
MGIFVDNAAKTVVLVIHDFSVNFNLDLVLQMTSVWLVFKRMNNFQATLGLE